ncbi:hypothetical protein C2845_PM09G02580 [Panicum miliaceum]|uniref:BTB/POZ and MATH domain-containing protein 2-like n=1 Tax=Panicum miliaceum TaxID=4540 RepID=A0A3L6RX10_PANMI|nr:hypothetical protein C2845_PM09G02580 [Panicum miliaceum]
MASASKRPRARTASTCSLETARGTHAFKIRDYSLHRALAAGLTAGSRFVQSATFTVGGHDWRVRCYPDGAWRDKHTDHVAAYLVLESENAEASAHFALRLVDQTTGQSVLRYDAAPPRAFSTKAGGGKVSTWGTWSFIKKSELEPEAASRYMRDDSIVIECDVTVVTNKKRRVEEDDEAAARDLEAAPPSDLSSNHRTLLEEKTGADVIFEVGDEAFPAHNLVLAMRSPVFLAELYGPMEEKTSQRITIEDMHPDVFRALLHFIYTDSMPDAMEDFEDEDDDDAGGREMTKHLLVAADRYAMGRLKRICEGILCRSLDVENVATTLALADQHHRSNLRNACVEFIASSSKIDDVVASQEHAHLKRSCPVVLVDMLENVTRRLQ